MKATPSRVILCVGTAALLFISTPVPALADPVTVPDDGSRPDGTADPGSSPTSGPGISRGPYAQKIAEQTRSLAELGERTTAAEERLKMRKGQTSTYRQSWTDLNDTATQTAELAGDMAALAYQEKAAEVPGVTDKFDELFQVNPQLLQLDQYAVAEEAEEARSDAAVAKASLDAATAAESIAKGQHTELSGDLKRDTAKLEKLIELNREAIATEEEQVAAENERELGAIGTDVDGTKASDEAKRAVKFALQQTGKPYVWGDEGPSTYDCSGLTQTSYGTPGVNLPRVAAEQYRDTVDARVPVERLLPGDLIFYGKRLDDWTSVYHVGMYVGDGQMVHAPRPGDVVKLAPVWFDEFVGAHRVVRAVDTKLPEPKQHEDEPKTKSPGDTPVIRPEPTPLPDTEEETTSGPGGIDAPTPTPTPHRG